LYVYLIVRTPITKKRRGSKQRIVNAILTVRGARFSGWAKMCWISGSLSASWDYFKC
jgi:hypothetical protein